MFASQATYIGIDPTAGRGMLAYAVIDSTGHVLARTQDTLENVLAFLAGQSQAVIAINAAPHPSQGLLAQPEVRDRFTPPPSSAWARYRIVEYQLHLHSISLPRTPPSEAEASSSARLGFEFYRRINRLGYHPFGGEAPLQWVEVNTNACYYVWAGKKPLARNLLEGRLQRQLILYETRLRLPDPMDFFEEITRYRLRQGILPVDNIYKPPILDALAASLTAWMIAERPDEVHWLGDPQEGLIVLPVKELKEKY
jgi:hypothetical protein